MHKNLRELQTLGIHSVEIDGTSIPKLDISCSLIGEQVKVYSEKHVLSLWCDDIPHFWGDSNLEFTWTTEGNFASSYTLRSIRAWQAIPDGLRLFVPPCVVQFEFELSDGILLSIGLFRIQNGKTEFLSTGEIAVNLGFGLEENEKLKVLYVL